MQIQAAQAPLHMNQVLLEGQSKVTKLIWCRHIITHFHTLTRLLIVATYDTPQKKTVMLTCKKQSPSFSLQSISFGALTDGKIDC